MTAFMRSEALRYAQTAGDPTQVHTAALKPLWLLAYREAQVQTLADAYLAIEPALLSP